MQDEGRQRVIEELEELLDAERSALLAGRIDEISRLFERKADLVEHLSGLESNQTEALGGLREKLRRNQVLLDQAAAGIRKVANRLTALRQVRDSLETYDERGSRRRVELDPETSVEKRA